MEINAFKPHLVLIGLMLISALALAFTVDVTLNDRAGVSMKLPSALDGGWVGDELRYSHNPENPKQYRASELDLPNIDPVTGEKLFTMSLAEYEALAKDTQFVKSIYTNDAAAQMFVSVVLSGRERDSIHRPERCLVGQGSSIVNQHFWNVVMPGIIEVPLEGREPLKVAVLETIRNYRGANGERKAYYGYYAYWFVGQNRETPSHYMRMLWLAWDRVVHSRSHKWAYIAVAGDRGDEKSDAYKQEVVDFIQKLYPHLLINKQGGS
ncbi:MAG: exosortase-associated EpsI family protein [Kiritimatiellaceae bacterium]|nr:exosortase-associated EpsI family protein [Kiritimatiellaceae bacterium]